MTINELSSNIISLRMIRARSSDDDDAKKAPSPSAPGPFSQQDRQDKNGDGRVDLIA